MKMTREETEKYLHKTANWIALHAVQLCNGSKYEYYTVCRAAYEFIHAYDLHKSYEAFPKLDFIESNIPGFMASLSSDDKRIITHLIACVSDSCAVFNFVKYIESDDFDRMYKMKDNLLQLLSDCGIAINDTREFPFDTDDLYDFQKSVVNYIYDFERSQSRGPTYNEIHNSIGESTLDSTQYNVDLLKEKGILTTGKKMGREVTFIIKGGKSYD